MFRPFLSIAALAALTMVAGLADASPEREKPWLGVVIGNAGDGALVHEVVEGTPAEDAGLRTGDVITKVGDKLVASSDQLIDAIAAHTVGKEVEFTVRRHRRSFTVRASLTRRLSDSELLARRWVGKLVPSFGLADTVTRKAVSVSRTSHAERVVVLIFFDSHCRTCGPLFRAAADLSARHPDVEFVGITSETIASLRPFLAKHSVNFPVLRDPSGAIRTSRFRAKATPTAFVVDREGVITFAGMAPELSADDLTFATKRAVGARPSL